MQHHHQHYVNQRRRSERIKNSNKTTYDDFYIKLERIRLSAATSSSKQYPQRTATELLAESKAYFVKSQEVLHNKQIFSTNQRIITPSFRTIQPRRCPYQDQSQSDFSSPSSTSSNMNIPDCVFESVSVLSLSDQTTLDSTNSSTDRKRIVVPSSVTIIERNARIIKWLFQLHKTNESSSSFQYS